MWLKIFLVVLIFATTLTVASYVWASRNPIISQEQIQQKQAADIIKKALDGCLQKVSDQLSDYDPNDLFMTRQVDATKSRCESLRNEYNFAIDEYNRLLHK